VPQGTFCDASFLDTGRPGGKYLRLRPDSRAIDAGNAAACPATDQQGLARPVDGAGTGIRACDTGSTEFYPVVNEANEESTPGTSVFPRMAGAR
jgi:hypothetical protein